MLSQYFRQTYLRWSGIDRTIMTNGIGKERIREDLNRARRERDKLQTLVLTTLLSEVRNREIELGSELPQEEIEQLVASGIKRRREAAEQMRAAGRDELAEKEDAEAAVLQNYLPPQLEPDEVRVYIREAIAAGASDLGAIMKTVMPRVKGRFEGRELNRLAREEMGG